MKTITLRILTPEGLVLEEPASSIIAPGEPGYLGMLANHAPLVTTLKPGRITWRRSDGSRQRVTVGSGLLDISHNRCTVLADAVSVPAPVSESRGAI